MKKSLRLKLGISWLGLEGLFWNEIEFSFSLIRILINQRTQWMIKMIMTVIRRAVTWGVTAPSLLKEISSRDLWKEGRSIRNEEGCIDRGETKISRPLEGKKLLGILDNFSIHEWATWHLVESGCALWLCWCCASLLDLLGPATQAGCSERKNEFSQIPISRTTYIIGVRTSKLNRSSAWSEMIFSWTIEQGRYMKSWVRSYWHGAEMDNNILVLDQPWW
jgi:hypothetical protein